MRLVSEEQLKALVSSGHPWAFDLFCFSAGIASSLFIQLMSGVVDPGSRNLLWAIFYPMVILTLAFAVTAIREHIKMRKAKQALINESQ